MPSHRKEGSMNGTRDLAALLSTLEPELSGTEMVFCSFANLGIDEAPHLRPVGLFLEAEGLTLIIPKVMAEQHGIPFEATFKAITLNVHSSLEAIGLTAAVASRLTLHGISANVIAAYYHDHIFVPTADAERAVQVLRALQAEAVASNGTA
jgi:hypothetical protein